MTLAPSMMAPRQAHETLLEELPYAIPNGRRNAVTGATLARRFGFRSDRAIRVAIRELITSGLPVASETSAPAGFFIADTEEEVATYAQALRDRLIADAVRRRDFIRAAKAIRYPGQLPLI